MQLAAFAAPAAVHASAWPALPRCVEPSLHRLADVAQLTYADTTSQCERALARAVCRAPAARPPRNTHRCACRERASGGTQSARPLCGGSCTLARAFQSTSAIECTGQVCFCEAVTQTTTLSHITPEPSCSALFDTLGVMRWQFVPQIVHSVAERYWHRYLKKFFFLEFVVVFFGLVFVF